MISEDVSPGFAGLRDDEEAPGVRKEV